MDPNSDGRITEAEFRNGVIAMTKEWKSLKKSWSGHETVSHAFDMATRVAYVVIAVIIWMFVFSVSWAKVLLPFVSLVWLIG